jgi:predicted NAD/FAD-binding protein
VIPAGQPPAAFNYLLRARAEDRRSLAITYYVSRVMRLGTVHPYFMTTNPVGPIDPALTLLDMPWRHPFFSVSAVETQARLPSLQGVRRTFFAGSYFSCGSHEDAVTSAEAACRALGVESTVASWTP